MSRDSGVTGESRKDKQGKEGGERKGRGELGGDQTNNKEGRVEEGKLRKGPTRNEKAGDPQES